MPDPGEPFGGEIAVQVMRSPPMSSALPATPAKPWPGAFVSVPAFINGCSVIAAIKLTPPPEDGSWTEHRFGVVYADDGRQGGEADTLVVATVSLGSGYRVREKCTGVTSYQDAVHRMMALAGLGVVDAG